MAINKKLIHFATRARFDTELASANILDTSIVFIRDTGEIWTHGKFYGSNFAPVSGSENYIQNQSDIAQSASIWINGNIKSNGVINSNSAYGFSNGELPGRRRITYDADKFYFVTDGDASAHINVNTISTASHGTSANWKASYDAIYGSTLSNNYLPKWDGSKLVNSGIIDNGDITLNLIATAAARVNSVTGYNSSLNYAINNVDKVTTQVVADGTDRWRVYHYAFGEALSILGSGFIGAGYTSDPTSGNKFAVNGNAFVGGDVKATGAVRAESFNGLYDSDVVWGGGTIYIGTGMYSTLRSGTDNSFNIDTYNGGSKVNALKILQNGDATFVGRINSTATYGFAIGNLANVARIHYGSQATNTFSFLTAGNGDADIYAGVIYTTSNGNSVNWKTAYDWGNHASAGYNALSSLSYGSWGGLMITTSSGYIDFGPANTVYAHIYTDRPNFYFNRDLLVNDNLVYHSGNFPVVPNDKLPQRLRHYTSQYGIDANSFMQSGFAYSTANLPANVNDANLIGVFHTDGGWGHQLAFRFGGSGVNGANHDGKDVYTRIYNSSVGSWYPWYAFLTSGNYTAFVPKLDGTGATGIWGISITGDAAGITTPTGTYKHLGAWGVGRTANGAILVNTAYYADSAGTLVNNATVSRDLYVYGGTGGSYGNRLIVGNNTITYSLEDANVRPIIQIHGAYPVLSLNHTVTSNGSHGPTVQFTANGTGSQFVIGMNGTGTQLDFGYSSASDWNPHNGIAQYNGTTVMRINSSGISALSGSFIGSLSGNASSATNFNNGTAYSSGGNVYGSYFYGSGSIRCGDMWDGAGLYRPSGKMVFGTENEGWRFSMAADQKVYIATDGNIWMKWANAYISTLLDGKLSTTATAASANFIYPVGSINSRNGYGIQSFYSWANEGFGYCNGITIGSHPGDQSYGWQIYQRMWDEKIYYRRYNAGYGTEYYLWSTANFDPGSKADSGHTHTGYMDISANRLYDNYTGGAMYAYNGRIYNGWLGDSVSVNYANYAGYSYYLPTSYAGGVQHNPQVYFGTGTGLKAAMTGHVSTWSDTLWINGYSGGDVPWMCALHTIRNSEPRMWISAQTHDSTSYGTCYEFITGYNIGSQKVDGSLKLWATSHSNDYYITNNWTGTYWQLTTNHGAGVQVAYADSAGTLNGYNATAFVRADAASCVTGSNDITCSSTETVMFTGWATATSSNVVLIIFTAAINMTSSSWNTITFRIKRDNMSTTIATLAPSWYDATNPVTLQFVDTQAGGGTHWYNVTWTGGGNAQSKPSIGNQRVLSVIPL